PPAAPLFPYTTLFRSESAHRLGNPAGPEVHWLVAGRCASCATSAVRNRLGSSADSEARLSTGRSLHIARRLRSTQPPRQFCRLRDRKSTRLNSSHVKI